MHSELNKLLREIVFAGYFVDYRELPANVSVRDPTENR